ncbi:unnamed protein product [Amoebophrya sp. A25]|nr:unnamed protein product [Amoebophrya sp. A25]|eukprot:GSA25T00005189001.1
MSLVVAKQSLYIIENRVRWRVLATCLLSVVLKTDEGERDDRFPMSAFRTISHEFTANDTCAHCCQPNLNGCEARVTPHEWFSYQVWNTSALDRFKVNLRKNFGGVNGLQICENVHCDHPVLGCGWVSRGKTQLRCAACPDLKNLHKSKTSTAEGDTSSTAAGSALEVVGCGNDLRYGNRSRADQFGDFFETAVKR